MDISLLLDKLSDLHKFYYLEKDTYRYNICDENANSIVYNENYDTLQSCQIYSDFNCKEISADSINNYTYADFERDDGIAFINKSILAHANKSLRSQLQRAIITLFNDKKIYGNGYSVFVDMLFIINENQVIVRDNFNIANVLIFSNNFQLFMSYLGVELDEVQYLHTSPSDQKEEIYKYLKSKKYSVLIYKNIVCQKPKKPKC